MAIKYVGPNALKKLCSLVKTALAGKINTSDIVQTTSESSSAKVPSAAVTNDLQDQVDELNTKTNGSILADIASGYSAISSSSGRAVYNKIGSLCIVDLQLTRSSAITSGSMTLPQSMPTPWSSFHGALADPSNGSVGHIEVNTNRMLYLRCQAGSGFLTGQLVYIAAQ